MSRFPSRFPRKPNCKSKAKLRKKDWEQPRKQRWRMDVNGIWSVHWIRNWILVLKKNIPFRNNTAARNDKVTTAARQPAKSTCLTHMAKSFFWNYLLNLTFLRIPLLQNKSQLILPRLHKNLATKYQNMYPQHFEQFEISFLSAVSELYILQYPDLTGLHSAVNRRHRIFLLSSYRKRQLYPIKTCIRWDISRQLRCSRQRYIWEYEVQLYEL
jgi:hypothetical protein